MKILVITNIFPNSQEPTRGMYNKQQFTKLAKLCELKVVAPIPWHHFSNVPEREMIDKIDVYHPRYFMIPKIGRSLYGIFFFISLLGKVKEIYRNFKFDLIFATWAYPDGVGSFLIAKALKKPIIIKVHGSDINVQTKYFLLRKMIVYALKNSQKIIAVSNALKDKMVKLGIPAEKIVTILNGVDTDLFKPKDQKECRKKLGLPLESRIILFVGNLVPIKGLDYLMDAFYKVASSREGNMRLVLIGDGNMKSSLLETAKRKNIDNMIDFMGRRPHDEIPIWLNSCDLFCLPSIEEGCPNAVLEAVACEVPVIATKTGGIPEIIEHTDRTILVKPRNSDELANAILTKLRNSNDNENDELCISVSDWPENAGRVYEEISQIMNMERRECNL